MPSGAQLRGMLLEEIILKALDAAGYDTVLTADGHLISEGGSGLELQGRGTHHQIDAIADYSLQQPFSHPQRLLLEAKCYYKGVGLEVIRNAVGVHKDVCEHWNSIRGREQRYHYQYAVFSGTYFAPEAEAYAFAQDIYLFPLGGSAFFRPILKAVWGAKTRKIEARVKKRDGFMKELRLAFRTVLRDAHCDVNGSELNQLLDKVGAVGVFNSVIEQARRLDGVLFAASRSGFLILLVPPLEGGNLAELITAGEEGRVRISVRRAQQKESWFLVSAAGEDLFTLDIPPKLFKLYANESSLHRPGLVNVKRTEFQVLQAPYRSNGRIKIARFVLDQNWLTEVQRSLRE